METGDSPEDVPEKASERTRVPGEQDGTRPDLNSGADRSANEAPIRIPDAEVNKVKRLFDRWLREH
jgi:hypothetical protein